MLRISKDMKKKVDESSQLRFSSGPKSGTTFGSVRIFPQLEQFGADRSGPGLTKKCTVGDFDFDFCRSDHIDPLVAASPTKNTHVKSVNMVVRSSSQYEPETCYRDRAARLGR